MNKNLINIGKKANKAINSKINQKLKNRVLYRFGRLIKKNKDKIIKENKKDINFAIKNGYKKNFIDRLMLDKYKVYQIVKSINNIAKLKDPTDITLSKWKRPNGLIIKRVTIPIGVIGIIYESRPNVTSDVSSLCFKSGNSVILRGGSEAYFSNLIISNLFRRALKENKVDENYVQFIKNRNRKIVDVLLSKMEKFIDVIIPRGGKNLVSKVQKLSRVPIIGHLEGNCHTYIDKDAKLNLAEKILYNAKLRNTSICGATETVLFHEKTLKKFVNPVLKKLEKNNCIIIADKKIKKIYKGRSKNAIEKDWSKEYLSPIISAKTVRNVKDAVDHINRYGTMHTDAILTQNKKTANFFLKNIKSSIAILNSSTQFADGGEFGFGGEVGISTNKLPPRGPVGLNQLVSYKYEILGTGQIRK